MSRSDPHAHRQNSFKCKCVLGTDGAILGKKIQCELHAHPRIRYVPGMMSDPNRGITDLEHERNHFNVYKSRWVPSFVDLFTYYSDVYCCNCEARRQELEALWKELDHRLWVWEDQNERPFLYGGPFVHNQPVHDYGSGQGSLHKIVHTLVNEKMDTECE